MSSSTPPVPPTPKVSAPPVPPEAVQPAPAEAGPERPRHGGDALSNPFYAFLTGAGTSILLHLAIIIAGVLLIEPVRDKLTGLITVEEQNIIPTAELATDTPGGIPNPGMNNTPDRAAAQSVDSSVTSSDNMSQVKSESLSQTLSNSPGEAPAVIGVGGSNTNLSSGSSGPGLAKFGVPGGGGGIGPKGAVFGNGGNAFRIVFICDGTGTMAEKMPILRRELLSTIAKLSPKQEYNVIFYRDGKEQGVAAVNPTLMNATGQNRTKTEQFLKNLNVSGDTDPTPAIEMAFRMRPQLIYLLSDGAFDRLKTYDEVIKQINDLNKDKTARVNTILFQNTERKEDTPEQLKQASAVMEKIAKANGGNFTAVDIRKLYGQ